jgi:hypothetical protein
MEKTGSFSPVYIQGITRQHRQVKFYCAEIKGKKENCLPGK